MIAQPSHGHGIIILVIQALTRPLQHIHSFIFPPFCCRSDADLDRCPVNDTVCIEFYLFPHLILETFSSPATRNLKNIYGRHRLIDFL